MSASVRTALVASIIMVAVLGTLLGGFWAMILQMLAIALVSTAVFRRDGGKGVLPGWQESRLSALASVLAALAATGLLVTTLYSIVRVFSVWLFEPAIRLIAFATISGPFFPLLRRRIPVATVLSSTLYGALLFGIQLMLWPYPEQTIPSLGLYFLLLVWMEYGYFLGLLLTHEGIRGFGLSARTRMFQEFMTLWCLLLVFVFVIIRYQILPTPLL